MADRAIFKAHSGLSGLSWDEHPPRFNETTSCYVCRKSIDKDDLCQFHTRSDNWDEGRHTHFDCAQAMRAICMLEGVEVVSMRMDWAS